MDGGSAASAAPPAILGLRLPPPASAARGLSLLILGFAVEGGTELYQFLQRGNLVQGALEYYTTLATTILGICLMALGFREGGAFHAYPGEEMRPRRSVRGAWATFALWAGGTAASGVLSLALGTAGTGATPWWIAWPVGGIVVLLLGRFFFGLRALAARRSSSLGRTLGWAGFAWSLGVATLAGLELGIRARQLLAELVTNWAALLVSLGPAIVAMSLLCVAYALMAAAFWPALRFAGRREGTA